MTYGGEGSIEIMIQPADEADEAYSPMTTLAVDFNAVLVHGSAFKRELQIAPCAWN